MTLLQPWWELDPDLLLQEEKALSRLGGTPPVLNERLLTNAKVRSYAVPYSDDDGTTYELTVTFSDLHPYFRVDVLADHRFGTHQQPFVGNLCLLRGSESEWDVTETAADMIAEQMPKLLADRTDRVALVPKDTDPRDEVGGEMSGSGEAVLPHVEPYVGYYPFELGAVARVDGSWPELVEAGSGTMVVGVEAGSQPERIRVTILQLMAEDGTVLREADSAVFGLFAETITGRWCRLTAHPDGSDAANVLEGVIRSHPALAEPNYRKFQGGWVDLVGVVFTDDIRADITTGEVIRGDAWMGVARSRGPTPGSAKKATGKRSSRRASPAAQKFGPYLVRSVRAGRADMAERVPSLSPLIEKKVALFGTGGIGAPSAIEFAKAGIGDMVLVDPDFLDPGNAPRWPLGYLPAGLHKLHALHHHLAQNWPYTHVDIAGIRVGGVRYDGAGDSQWEGLEAILAGVDLIYDATAELGVNYFLSDLARDRGLPYVVVSGTEGGWGGCIARIRPEHGSVCWKCLILHMTDNPDMLPPADPDPVSRNVWPAGCTDPTFTGTGFDIGAIALAGVRLAASTLCGQSPGAYPPAAWDYARYSFRSADEALCGAAQSYRLEQHPRCSRCSFHQSG